MSMRADDKVFDTCVSLDHMTWGTILKDPMTVRMKTQPRLLGSWNSLLGRLTRYTNANEFLQRRLREAYERVFPAESGEPPSVTKRAGQSKRSTAISSARCPEQMPAIRLSFCSPRDPRGSRRECSFKWFVGWHHVLAAGTYVQWYIPFQTRPAVKPSAA